MRTIIVEPVEPQGTVVGGERPFPNYDRHTQFFHLHEAGAVLAGVLLEPLHGVLPRPGLVDMRVNRKVIAVAQESAEVIRCESKGVVQQGDPVGGPELHQLVGAPVELLQKGQRYTVPGLIHYRYINKILLHNNDK